MQVSEVQASIGDLFVRARSGDQHAWAEIVNRLNPAIWGAANRYSLSKAQAEDVGQTVWLRLVDNMDKIRDPDRLAGWIKTTERNEALAVVKKQMRSEPTDSIEVHVDTAPGPEVEIDEHVTTVLMLAGLAQLDARCQLLLRLLAAKASYKEAADHLELAVGSIGATKERCLNKLRATDEVRQVIKAVL